MKKESKRIYRLEMTERQAKLISYVCDRFSRLICGQDWVYQELMEEAWEKRCKEAVGGHGMDNEWDGGWYNMRHDAEEICKQIKKRFWGLERNALYGIHYDDTADILFDIHCVLRYQIWLDGDRSFHGVDSDEPLAVGGEPLARIERIDKDEWKSTLTPPNVYLYSEFPIYTMVSDICEVKKNDGSIVKAIYVSTTTQIPDNYGNTKCEEAWFEMPVPDYPLFFELLRNNTSIDVVEWRYIH